MPSNMYYVVYIFQAKLLDGLEHQHHTARQQEHRQGCENGATDLATNQFMCHGRPPGYYADMQLDCQVSERRSKLK